MTLIDGSTWPGTVFGGLFVSRAMIRTKVRSAKRMAVKQICKIFSFLHRETVRMFRHFH